MARKTGESRFTLEVPIDASEVEEFDPARPVKVVVVDEEGRTQSEVTRLDKGAHASVTFGFAELPRTLRVILGPEDAGDDELIGLQTINVVVPGRQWLNQPKLTLRPIVITSFYWRWWLSWCRTFTIRGRVVCSDGTPVPGAVVTAIDTDFWWWWCSKQTVGSATTDLTGSFKLQFRWCCGWWPWWWWAIRHWHLEPKLAETILPVLHRELKLVRPPIPGPDPDPQIFEQILRRGKETLRQPSSLPAQPHVHATEESSKQRVRDRLPLGHAATFDPTTLDRKSVV